MGKDVDDDKEAKSPLQPKSPKLKDPQSPVDADDIDLDEKDSDDEEETKQRIIVPSHVRIAFWDREWFNMILYLFYKMLRILYVSVWYYFFPFIALMSSYIVPKMA